MKKYTMSIDAETDGLWGDPFAIAAIIYDSETETEIDKFVGRLNDDVVNDQWVFNNVLPCITDIEVTHNNLQHLLHDFTEFYKKYKNDSDIICHMGYIVESYLFRLMYHQGLIGQWDAPFPLIDVSGHLDLAGENPTSVDAYIAKYNISITDYGTTHNPLYDCEVTAKVYFHLKK